MNLIEKCNQLIQDTDMIRNQINFCKKIGLEEETIERLRQDKKEIFKHFDKLCKAIEKDTRLEAKVS